MVSLPARPGRRHRLRATYSFPVIAALGGAEPMHGNFATRVSHAISAKRVIPVALTMPVTGIGLIWSAGINPFERDTRWLLTGITLYVIALAYSLAVQTPTVNKIIALTAGPPPGAAPAGPPGGPPPGLMDLVGKVKRGGMFLTVVIAVIVFLMVVKPGFPF